MGGGYVLDKYDGRLRLPHGGLSEREPALPAGFLRRVPLRHPAPDLAPCPRRERRSARGRGRQLYQKDPGTAEIPASPTFTGRTDAAGLLTLPTGPSRGSRRRRGTGSGRTRSDRSTSWAATSRCCWRSRNGGQRDYRWLEVNQLNEAFWRGQRQQATIEIRSGLIPSRPIAPENLALRRRARPAATRRTRPTPTTGTPLARPRPGHPIRRTPASGGRWTWGGRARWPGWRSTAIR